jgi:PhzF family phenazine biosynthesis protein
MRTYHYRIVNVFAESTLAGNPLCVFEDGRGLDDLTMLAIARQFNLSETTFLLPSDAADMKVRVFTPSYEMRFAGHPTLGSAHVLRALRPDLGHAVTLEFKAGVVPVKADGDHWEFRAPSVGMPGSRPTGLDDALVASLVGLKPDDLLRSPMWVDTGADQLMIAVKDAAAVLRATPDSARLELWPLSSLQRKTAYVFAFTGDGTVLARYFFTVTGGGVSEDPGTGSACANLGGWLIVNEKSLPASYVISQGEQVGRPCKLSLKVTPQQEIFVGGQVIELGRGSIAL